MLGLPIDVAAGVVVAFILFGQALYAVGGDKFLTDLALIATGRYRGGPAKVSVVSSALFGTVSGSAVANVVVDGAITIPLMKSTGFPGHLAAAIEAVASNGGQITAAGHGRRGFFDGGVSKYPLRPDRARRGDPRLRSTIWRCSPRSIWKPPNAAYWDCPLIRFPSFATSSAWAGCF